jgi:hypothetical protein
MNSKIINLLSISMMPTLEAMPISKKLPLETEIYLKNGNLFDFTQKRTRLALSLRYLLIL